ncbi:MAG: S8 family serine peptidase, partial [Bacteroidota bacterium]
MKKLLLILLLFTCAFTISAQEKFFIYFKDKGVPSTTALQKSSPLFKVAEQTLSLKAIERRKQVMGEDNYVTFEDIPLNENYLRQVETLGVKIENRLKWFSAVTSYLNDDQLRQIKNLPFVEKVERVRVFKSRRDEKNLIEASDEGSTKSLNKIQFPNGLNYGPSLTQAELSEIPSVHELGITGKEVLVGILDTGFRWKSHPAIKNTNVVAEKDFIQKDDITENQFGDATNQDSHGTSVLSIIAGNAPGSLIGPAFGASYILAKTEYVPTETKVEEDNYAAALEWMESLGVDLTTSSLGYSEFDAPDPSYTYTNLNGKTTIVAKAANLAFERGISTFTAAGNEAASNWGRNEGGNSFGKIISPADALDIIAVGAVSSNNLVTNFSSRGPTSDGRIKPEVVAMGSSVVNATAGTTLYNYGAGTSFATPIAAGIGALLKSVYPHLTNRQIRKIFIECGDNSANPNNDRGYGLISAKRVIAYPNLGKENNTFKLNKIFIGAANLLSSTVRLNYKIGSSTIQSVPMNYDGVFKYDYVLPSSIDGDQFEFYFTYQANGATVREPANGNYKFSYGSLNISNVTSVAGRTELPMQFNLFQNFPNPFNPETVISWQIAVNSYVTLKVYDLLGREVATLVDEKKAPGNYEV